MTRWQHADIYLAKPLLLFQRLFGKLLPFRFHGQTHNVLFANCYELLSLQQRRVELYFEKKPAYCHRNVIQKCTQLSGFACRQQGFSANLCNFLFVVNNKKWHRQQDGSEAFHCFLKPPGGGQLVTLLQAGDEVCETQAHSWESIFRPVFLKRAG